MDQTKKTETPTPVSSNFPELNGIISKVSTLTDSQFTHDDIDSHISHLTLSEISKLTDQETLIKQLQNEILKLKEKNCQLTNFIAKQQLG